MPGRCPVEIRSCGREAFLKTVYAAEPAGDSGHKHSRGAGTLGTAVGQALPGQSHPLG